MFEIVELPLEYELYLYDLAHLVRSHQDRSYLEKKAIELLELVNTYKTQIFVMTNRFVLFSDAYKVKETDILNTPLDALKELIVRLAFDYYLYRAWLAKRAKQGLI